MRKVQKSSHQIHSITTPQVHQLTCSVRALTAREPDYYYGRSGCRRSRKEAIEVDVMLVIHSRHSAEFRLGFNEHVVHDGRKEAEGRSEVGEFPASDWSAFNRSKAVNFSVNESEFENFSRHMSTILCLKVQAKLG